MGGVTSLSYETSFYSLLDCHNKCYWETKIYLGKKERKKRKKYLENKRRQIDRYNIKDKETCNVREENSNTIKDKIEKKEKKGRSQQEERKIETKSQRDLYKKETGTYR